jgi:precorrin-2 dehydrogenase/sirohydrochlorin ferrochelatase
VTVFPAMIDGSKISAVVVGGGAVATRKITALIAGGVFVRVVAPSVSTELRALASQQAQLRIIDDAYDPKHIGDALIVIAATNDAAVNARICDDATVRGRLVNVVDAPERGNFVTPATHRSGDLTIAVSAGRLPAAASAIRDAIAARFDDRYASSIAELRRLRDSLVASGDRDAWKTIVAELLSDGFCSDVEDGSMATKVGAWR